MALEGTSVREPLRDPAATLGILESGNLDGPVNLGSCLKICQLSTQWRFPHWGVGDGLESLGILLSAQSDAGALTSLSALVHRDLWLLRHTNELPKNRIAIECLTKS